MNLTPMGSQIGNTPLMDDILAVRDDLDKELDNAPAQPLVPGELSEAFTMLDPDLAYLYKELKTSALQLENAITKGQMMDMAQWRFESAKSAYQTRLAEIKDDKILKKFAEKTVTGECDIERAKRDLRNHSMQEAMNEQFALRRKQKAEEKRRKEEREGGWFFYMMLGLWLAQMQAQQRAQNLNMSKMQTDFFNARTA